MGIIIAISDLLTVRLPGQSHDTSKRNLRLMDIDGRTINTALWGQHAVSFDGKELYKKGQSEPLIILLVGTLMKDYRGRETISCGEAATYYINPDIPEVATYRESLGKQLPIVEWMSAADDQYQKAYKQIETIPVKVETLISTDPNDFIDKNLVCTVTLTKVKSPSWWFLACSRCHKTAYSAGTEFACSDIACPSIAAEPRYKVSMIGTDGTGETEFVFFGGIAEQVIGKQIDVLVRAAARKPDGIPAEISTLVTQKYTLNVSIAEKGLQFGYIAFQVNNIDAVHAKARPFEFSTHVSTSKQLATMDSLPGTSQVSLPDIQLTTTDSPQISEADQSNVLTASAETGLASLETTPVPATPSNIEKPATEPLPDADSGTKSRTRKRSPNEENKNAPIKKLFK